ncbi:MAG: M42 family metallopeptidase [Clostridiales bacterium]|nr:M42 family metallopeptidase [Clostridiales bacterium]
MDRSQMMPALVDTLRALANTPSPTGMTQDIEALLMQHLRKLGFTPWQSKKGAVFVKLNEAKGEGILLSAHIDTLGLMVRSIKGNGRLRITQLGGFPLQYAEQENVQVHTRGGELIPGTLRMNQPAVHANKDLPSAERTDDTMEIVLDRKVATKEQTEALGVCAGDFISLNPRFVQSDDGFIKSRHMDDKASAAVLLTLARAFSEGKASCTRPVYLLFTNYEEVGHGASSAHPEGITDMIAVDMGVVGDDLSTDELKVSICAKDSGGAYHRALTGELIDTAKAHNLAFAVDIYPYYGSDAGAALRAGYDYRHALIGPGVAASHGYERVNEDGLWNTLMLLVKYLGEQ